MHRHCPARCAARARLRNIYDQENGSCVDNPEQLLATHPHAILFECIAGSRAYGTANANSDEDTRGVFAVPASEYLKLERPLDQVSDQRGDVVYFSLRRVIELLTQANPNILELLFMPDDCVLRTSPMSCCADGCAPAQSGKFGKRRSEVFARLTHSVDASRPRALRRAGARLDRLDCRCRWLR